MKGSILLYVLLLGLSAISALAGNSLPIVQGRFEMVVCAQDQELKVRADNLKQILFLVPNHEPLKIFQGWGQVKKTVFSEDGALVFIKVQFPRLEEAGERSVGWIEEASVKLRSQCSEIRREEEGLLQDAWPSRTWGKRPVEGGIRGLNDPRCCQFPTKWPVTSDFSIGIKRFGARRDRGGRLHAACDLYRHVNEPIVAVAPGHVIRDKYFFYQGTYALEVLHNGGFVVRYGEVTGQKAPGVVNGSGVQTGQTVAYMGKVNSNCCEPMLHFELFSGAARGSLSGGGPYQRRSDLLNPTRYLRKWESDTFKFRR